MIGATASRLAIMTPTSDIIRVRSNARFGSPSRDVTENTCRNGITPSLAIACSKRGALKKINIKLLNLLTSESINFYSMGNHSNQWN